MNDSTHPIEFCGLTHYYGDHCAIHELNLRVPRGSIFALLGRNGAGKSTALRCLLGLQEPTRGTTRVLGHDSHAMPPSLRNRIGFVSENHGLVGWMRVRHLIRFQAASFASFDANACREQVARLGISEKHRVSKLSRGQRAQLALALVIAQQPEVVVLDDPALGLDAVIRREFLETMIELIQEEGRTLLFTSHLLGDVERVCDHVAILDQGVLRVDAPLDVVKQRVTRVRAQFSDTPPDVPDPPGLVHAREFRNELSFTMLDGNGALEDQLRELGAREVQREPLSLEEIFVDYTSESRA